MISKSPLQAYLRGLTLGFALGVAFSMCLDMVYADDYLELDGDSSYYLDDNSSYYEIQDRSRTGEIIIDRDSERMIIYDEYRNDPQEFIMRDLGNGTIQVEPAR